MNLFMPLCQPSSESGPTRHRKKPPRWNTSMFPMSAPSSSSWLKLLRLTGAPGTSGGCRDHRSPRLCRTLLCESRPKAPSAGREQIHAAPDGPLQSFHARVGGDALSDHHSGGGRRPCAGVTDWTSQKDFLRGRHRCLPSRHRSYIISLATIQTSVLHGSKRSPQITPVQLPTSSFTLTVSAQAGRKLVEHFVAHPMDISGQPVQFETARKTRSDTPTSLRSHLFSKANHRRLAGCRDSTCALLRICHHRHGCR